MAIDNINVGQELLNVPMGEMIRSMALGIAEAQWELDKAGMTVAELMSGQRLLRDLDTGKLLSTQGEELGAEAEPHIVDSRVYFGYTYNEGEDGKWVRQPQKLSMMELGFTPTFYQFVDTIIEVRIAITMSREQETTRASSTTQRDVTSKDLTVKETTAHGWWYGGYSQTRHKNVGRQTTALASSVDANYSNKFSYSVEGSSLLRTKLVPVPPPAILEERIRQVMAQEEAHQSSRQENQGG